MTDLKIFDSCAFGIIRSTMVQHQPWFCAKDVAKALGYAIPKDAIRQHVFDEDRSTLDNLMGGAQAPHAITHQERTSVYISEPGLYALIFGSKLEEAKVFKRWVCQDVLPRLRKSLHLQAQAPLALRNETDLHYKVVHFIRKYLPHAIIAPGLGELQDSSEKRLDAWKKGYKSGTPDILLLNCHKYYNGLAIELKRPDGRGTLSEKQSSFLHGLELANYKTLVSCEYDEILVALLKYFEETRVCCPHCSRRFRSETTLGRHLRHFHRHCK